MFDFIEKIIYINLEHRIDRKKLIEKQLSIFPTEKVERFNAIYDPERGHLGCSKSHIAVLKLAIQNNWNNYLVVEDDAEFCNLENSYQILEQLVKNPYDVIVLGGTSLSCDTSTHRLYNCCCTTAYMVSNQYYSKLLKNFEDGASLLEKNYNRISENAIDQYWHNIQRIDNWYCVFPVLCKQISDYSDIEKMNINKNLFNNTNILTLNPKFLTVHLMGGLGNQLFQLAFLLYTSKISKNPIFLNTLTSPDAGHSSEQYFETLLKKWKPNFSKKTTITLNENHKLAYEDWKLKIHSVKQNIELYGYFQRYEYVDLIRDEFISRLTFDETILKKYPNISNKFFIHVRGGDYRGNKFHDINLTYYYTHCMNLHPEEEFVIFTNDIDYAMQLLPDIPIITENEIDSLFLMSRAKGCICANSSFSWWGAYLNLNRPIYFPSKWFNDSTMDTSGYYFPKSEKISVNLESFIEKSKPLNFKSFVDKVIYINLNKRTEYKQKIERELSIFPFNIVQRFPAISNSNTAVGCTISHISVLEMAIKEGWKNYLVVEDDMTWKNFDFSCISKLTDSTYDVILLGGNNVNYNKDTNKLINAQSTTAYIVNQSYYNTLLRNFKEGVFNLQITGDSTLYAIDKNWTSLQKRDNWYFVDLCYQGETYSDVENQLVNYNSTNRGSVLNILGHKR